MPEETSSKLWGAVLARLGHLPNPGRYVEGFKRGFPGDDDPGGEAIPIEGGPTYTKAVEMLAAGVEELYVTHKLDLARARHRIRQEEFWLAFLEQTGLYAEGPFIFDPASASVRRRSGTRGTPPASYHATLARFAQLVELALWDPLAAGRMADDPVLPPWLREMARTVGTGTLAPSLRGVLEECLAEPQAARRWHAVAMEDGMPGWFAEVAEVLGARRTPCGEGDPSHA